MSMQEEVWIMTNPPTRVEPVFTPEQNRLLDAHYRLRWYAMSHPESEHLRRVEHRASTIWTRVMSGAWPVEYKGGSDAIRQS